MEERRSKRPNDLTESHEPVAHLKVWFDGSLEQGPIRILTEMPDGSPVKLTSVEASLLADMLRRLSEPGIPDGPYEPGTSGFDRLMHQLCVEWGFCGCIKEGRPMHVTFLLPAKGPVTAKQFAEWALLAENWNPNSEEGRRWTEKIGAAFVECMGNEIVDVHDLRWSNLEA